MILEIGKPYKAIDPNAVTSGTIKDLMDGGKVVLFHNGTDDYRIPYDRFCEYFERLPEDPVAP